MIGAASHSKARIFRWFPSDTKTGDPPVFRTGLRRCLEAGGFFPIWYIRFNFSPPVRQILAA